MYTRAMRLFVKATKPTPPKTKDTVKIAYLYVGILLLLLVTQILTFKGLLNLAESWGMPGGVLFSNWLIAVLIFAEIFALPFLLRLKLSPLARIMSMVMTWIVPVIWVFISLWINLSVNAISNVGMLGTLVQLVPGWWVTFIAIAIGILAAWASWGMWPKNNKK